MNPHEETTPRANPEQTSPWPVDIFKGKNGKYFVRLKGGNGERTMIGQGYTRRWNAERFAETLVAKGLQGFVLEAGK